jgi:hypothetical protein
MLHLLPRLPSTGKNIQKCGKYPPKGRMEGGKVLMDESDDELVLPGDVLASYEEMVEAAAFASKDAEVKARLLKAAEFILARSKQVKRTCQPEDLLHDAIEAILNGSRKTWRKNRVDFKGLLVGVMRSIVSSREKSQATKSVNILMEHELPLHGEEQEPQSLEEIAADPETTESRVLKKERDAEEVSLMAILRAKYEPTELHGRILDKIKEGFSSHAEIQEALGIEESAYRNAWKVLMRAAESLNLNAKEQ